MNIKLRHETENDYRQVEELTREAFWNLYFPGCDEHYLVHIMRNHPDFVKELAFVAEVDGQIAGNIMYTKSWLSSEAENKDILSFGPVCVSPKYQRQGIGRALIQHTLALAREQGVEAVVILGDPHNYCTHGFKNCKDFNVSDVEGNHPLGMMVLELKQNALAGQAWTYKYSDVYNLDPQKVDEFDKTFLPKVKKHQSSQDVFNMMVRAVLK